MLDHLELPAISAFRAMNNIPLSASRLAPFVPSGSHRSPYGRPAPDDAMHLLKDAALFPDRVQGSRADLRAGCVPRSGTSSRNGPHNGTGSCFFSHLLRFRWASRGPVGRHFSIGQAGVRRPSRWCSPIFWATGKQRVECRDMLFKLAKHKVGAVPPDIPILPLVTHALRSFS